jgi:penicillin V acylase-like amidase (Ntn superfamily)
MVTTYGIALFDGLNERGLAGHMLYLKATDFAPRDLGFAKTKNVPF